MKRTIHATFTATDSRGKKISCLEYAAGLDAVGPPGGGSINSFETDDGRHLQPLDQKKYIVEETGKIISR